MSGAIEELNITAINELTNILAFITTSLAVRGILNDEDEHCILSSLERVDKMLEELRRSALRQ